MAQVTISIEEYDSLREFEKLAAKKYAIYKNVYSNEEWTLIFPEKEEFIQTLKEYIEDLKSQRKVQQSIISDLCDLLEKDGKTVPFNANNERKKWYK